MVLVVSWPGDEHARVVIAELARLGVAARLLDLGRFPRELGVVARRGGEGDAASLIVDGEALSLDAPAAIWWRRPRPFVLHDEIAAGEYADFGYGEAVEAFAGLWQSLDVAWVNHPVREQVASRKLFQLSVAREAGLDVPRTVVTNDPGEARAFLAECDGTPLVCKTFLPAAHDWRETRIVGPGEIGALDAVRYAPVIFQEYLPVELDLRVTWIGGEATATAIRPAPGSYAADYRVELERAEVTAHELPPAVARGLAALMDRLELAYGAIDLRLTPEGRYAFLEVNPSGEWLFLERRSGQPITATFARLLADTVPPCPPDSRADRPVERSSLSRSG